MLASRCYDAVRALRAAWYSVFLNSLVHVFMYAYYFAATALGANPAARRRYLWWGRYLTQFQVRGWPFPGRPEHGRLRALLHAGLLCLTAVCLWPHRRFSRRDALLREHPWF